MCPPGTIIVVCWLLLDHLTCTHFQRPDLTTEMALGLVEGEMRCVTHTTLLTQAHSRFLESASHCGCTEKSLHTQEKKMPMNFAAELHFDFILGGSGNETQRLKQTKLMSIITLCLKPWITMF